MNIAIFCNLLSLKKILVCIFQPILYKSENLKKDFEKVPGERAVSEIFEICIDIIYCKIIYC